MIYKRIGLFIASLALSVCGQESSNATTDNRDSSIYIGPCTWVINRGCPDEDVKFWLFTQSNIEERQRIHVDDTWEKSNISSSFYDPRFPVKVIIHGYNSDMELTPLIDMKQQYLSRGQYNLFYVDWSVLGPAPCYPAAVHNTRHVGICIAQLVDRIKETGNTDLHLIGFSLGAHVTNYASLTLKPNFTVPRITGLDPAMPLFVTASLDNKLDATDAEFVDVFHTNAMVQGKIEQCGHVDYYFNGGVYQPGCHNRNVFQCSHHRAPDYFAESIQSSNGFWGWKCQSYIYYMLGMCVPMKDQQSLAGEDCRSSHKGLYFLKTNQASPFALGRLTEALTGQGQDNFRTISFPNLRNGDPFLKEIDPFRKLEGNFNNLPFPKDEDDQYFFTNQGSDEISHNYISQLRHPTSRKDYEGQLRKSSKFSKN